MQLVFDRVFDKNYTSSSQQIRIQSERWVDQFIYCPNCGNEIDQYPNNKPVADYVCTACLEEYELKSKNGKPGRKIVDGQYDTMIERLMSQDNPNFFFLNYKLSDYSIQNFCVIPKHFITPALIEKRKPLQHSAKRAGWTGCNILIKDIPNSGRIFYVRDGQILPKPTVLSEWQRTIWLRQETDFMAKGWLLDVMKCIERIGSREFSLQQIYSFEAELAQMHPGNKHIKDKIRQQLQILRDKEYLKFVAVGRYQLL